MKKLFLIISLVISAGKIGAQTLAKNDLPAKETSSVSENALANVPEYPGYKVNCIQNKTTFSFEVISPKSEKAELKLVTSAWGDVCTIYKGAIREGKNVITVRSPKVRKGTYYVVSKLSGGE